MLSQPAHLPPRTHHQRPWLWLLLAVWLLTQSWAWHHRVEHGSHWQGMQGSTAGAAVSALRLTEQAQSGDLHAGADCEWLDHALLASLVGASAALVALAQFSGQTPFPPTFAQVALRVERPYFARAPPVLSHFSEGRVTG